jgi:GNAT superfamily N-acetyltransferase
MNGTPPRHLAGLSEARTRPLRYTDWPAVVRLARDIDSDLDLRSLGAYLRDHVHMSGVIEHDRKVVGFYVFTPQPARHAAGDNAAHEQPAWIDYFGVDAAQRRHGLGGRLLAALEAHAHGVGCTSLALDVLEDNPAGRALYEHGGFACEGLFARSGILKYRYHKDLGAAPPDTENTAHELMLAPLPVRMQRRLAYMALVDVPSTMGALDGGTN